MFRVCLVLISACPSWSRSWPCLRKVGGTCWRWCMRNRRGGPTRSRATPASAACALRSARPAGSSRSLRIPCSSLNAPSTVIGIITTEINDQYCQKGILKFTSAKALTIEALFLVSLSALSSFVSPSHFLVGSNVDRQLGKKMLIFSSLLFPDSTCFSGTSLQLISTRTSAWMRQNGPCTRTGTAGCTASLASTLSWMVSSISELHLRYPLQSLA